MNKHWIPIIAVGLSAWTAQAKVTLTFEKDTAGVVAGGDAITLEHDPSNGGRVMFKTGSGWKPSCVQIDFTATQELTDEWTKMSANGGKLTFTITLEPPGITGGTGAPGWFEGLAIATNPWEFLKGTVGGATLINLGGQFPLTEAKVTTSVVPIESSAVAVSDANLQVNPDGSARITLGLNTPSGAFDEATMYLDDLIIEGNSAAPVVQQPKMSIEPTKPGLNLYAAGQGQYDRECLRTTAPEYSWVDLPGPVTYSVTLKDYPKLQGFTTVIYLAPGSDIAASMNAPDWGRAVCALAWINNNADGSGNMRFAYKNEKADSNGLTGHEYWVNDNGDTYVAGDQPRPDLAPGEIDGTGKGGTIAYVNSTNILGTWSITFKSKTAVTLSAPDGTTAEGAFNEATPRLFAGPLYAYFGIVPSQTANVGLGAVFSRIQITGVPTPIDEKFAAPIAPEVLEKSAVTPAGVVQVIEAVNPFWVKWTMPATGFGLQQSTLKQPVTWVDLPTTDSFVMQNQTWKILNSADLLSSTNIYFRLLKP